MSTKYDDDFEDEFPNDVEDEVKEKTATGGEAADKQNDNVIIAEESFESGSSKEKADSYQRTGIKLIDDVVTVIHKHCRSSYKQITAITVFDMAYVAAYSGLKGTAHYLFDFSISGSGKDSSAEHSKELLLSPVMETQKILAKDYARERKEDPDLPSKMFKCIHGGDSTVQAIYKGFEVVPTQAIRRGEVGQLMQDKANPLMNFTTDNYGKKRIEMPSYKKEIDENIPLEVTDASLFFYGNSNLSMLGIKAFKYHMKGGLLNRCILLFEDYVRPFDELPKIYDLSQIDVIGTNDKVESFIAWGNTHRAKEKPFIRKTPGYSKFSKWVYDKEDALRGGEAQEIHKRTMQNLDSIIYTFHYLHCFENNIWLDMATVKTVSDAIKYMEWIISRYPVLIDEVSGVNDEIRTDKKSIKVIEYINDHKLPILFRQVYRKFNITRKEVEIIIAGVFKHDGKTITSRIMT